MFILDTMWGWWKMREFSLLSQHCGVVQHIKNWEFSWIGYKQNFRLSLISTFFSFSVSVDPSSWADLCSIRSVKILFCCCKNHFSLHEKKEWWFLRYSERKTRKKSEDKSKVLIRVKKKSFCEREKLIELRLNKKSDNWKNAIAAKKN